MIMISGPYDTTHNGLWSSNIIAQNCMCNTRTCGGGQGRVLFDEYCNGSGRSRDHLMRRECICSMSARRGVWSTRVTGYSRSTIWPWMSAMPIRQPKSTNPDNRGEAQT